MTLPRHITDHRLIRSHHERAATWHFQARGSDVGRQVWELVNSCVGALRRTAERGGPAPEAHLAELRRAMLRTPRVSPHRRHAVELVIALLRAQLDPRAEAPVVPLTTRRGDRPTPVALEVLRDLRVVDHVLRTAS